MCLFVASDPTNNARRLLEGKELCCPPSEVPYGNSASPVCKMEEFELDYGVQEIRLSEDHTFRVTTVGDEALPLELLLDLETRREEISGQRLWEGSLLLCAHLLKCSNQEKSRFDLKGKSVLELGAGTGVVSMLAHGLGASPVVVTDGDEKCVIMAQKNMFENGMPQDEVFVKDLRWGEIASQEAFCDAFFNWQEQRPGEPRSGPKYKAKLTPNEAESPLAMSISSKDRNSPSPSDFQRQAGSSHHCTYNEEMPSRRAPPRSFDFILAGDVLYKHTLLDPFLTTVDEMLAPGGQLFLCHIPRAGVTYDEVEQAITRAGFKFRVVDSGEGCGLSVGETTTEVGGIELCVDDARRARLYAVSRIP